MDRQTMGSYRLAVMVGDGIGPEVMAEAVRVLEGAAATQPDLQLEFDYLPTGLEAHQRLGSTLPDGTLTALESYAGWLLGPLSTHLYRPDDPTMPNPSAVLRRRFRLYANIRPARSFPGVPALYPDVDLIVVRENTEGFYADRNLVEGSGELKPTEDLVISVRVVTRQASEAVARAAFELARNRRRRVTAVHKANVLRRGCGLFLEACRAVGREFPEVELDDMHVDAAALELVRRPQRFDVIVTENMFGDILSNEAAGLVGGLGLMPGLNAGAERAMAQAAHGSAPDIAGKGIANPVAEILSGALLLDWLGRRHRDEGAVRAAARIEAAVVGVLADGRVRTPDIGGEATTVELGQAIADRVRTVSGTELTG
jgi:3-isopropylmalate dehydrogenase